MNYLEYFKMAQYAIRNDPISQIYVKQWKTKFNVESSSTIKSFEKSNSRQIFGTYKYGARIKFAFLLFSKYHPDLLNVYIK